MARKKRKLGKLRPAPSRMATEVGKKPAPPTAIHHIITPKEAVPVVIHQGDKVVVIHAEPETWTHFLFGFDWPKL